ncbi:MAG: hypothetical protein WEE51_11825, partial [Pirellulaceae bacterium]
MAKTNSASRMAGMARGAVSVAVLGGFLVAGFGEQALTHLQRYRFLGLESCSWLAEGPNYHLREEFQYVNQREEPRRLFVFEGAGAHKTHSRMVITDSDYRFISSADFERPDEIFRLSLVDTMVAPVVEVLVNKNPGVDCIQFQINDDQLTR